jgi:hypothetical protein
MCARLGGGRDEALEAAAASSARLEAMKREVVPPQKRQA